MTEEEFKAEETILLRKAKKKDLAAMKELGDLYSFHGEEKLAEKLWKKARQKGSTTSPSQRLKLKAKPSNNGCIILIVSMIIVFTALFVFLWIKQDFITALFAVPMCTFIIFVVLIWLIDEIIKSNSR